MEIDTAREVFEKKKVNSLGIDVATHGVRLLISKLLNVKSVKAVSAGGVYHMDNSISQVLVETTMTEDELDDWLYNASFPREVDIMGTFENKRNQFDE